MQKYKSAVRCGIEHQMRFSVLGRFKVLTKNRPYFWNYFTGEDNRSGDHSHRSDIHLRPSLVSSNMSHATNYLIAGLPGKAWNYLSRSFVLVYRSDFLLLMSILMVWSQIKCGRSEAHLKSSQAQRSGVIPHILWLVVESKAGAKVYITFHQTLVNLYSSIWICW